MRAALPDHARLALALGYHTAMRLGEVRGLRWEQVNFLDGIIRLNAGETKNDEAREIPLCPELEADLQAQHRRAQGPFVCFRVTWEGKAVPLGDFRKVWHASCVKLGLGRWDGKRYVGLIFHDLRRTFITDAEHAGAPRHEIMKGTGAQNGVRLQAVRHRKPRRTAGGDGQDCGVVGGTERGKFGEDGRISPTARFG